MANVEPVVQDVWRFRRIIENPASRPGRSGSGSFAQTAPASSDSILSLRNRGSVLALQQSDFLSLTGTNPSPPKPATDR